MIIVREIIAKWKIHVLLGCAFLLPISFSVVVNLVAGEQLLAAAWRAVREIRPMEVLTLGVFWYACAFYQSPDEWSSSFIKLNLGSKDKELS